MRISRNRPLLGLLVLLLSVGNLQLLLNAIPSVIGTKAQNDSFTHNFRFEGKPSTSPGIGVEGDGAFNYQTGVAAGDGVLTIVGLAAGDTRCLLKFAKARDFSAGLSTTVTLTSSMESSYCGPPRGHLIDITIRTGDYIFVDLRGYGFVTITGTVIIEQVGSLMLSPANPLLIAMVVLVIVVIAAAYVFMLRKKRRGAAQ